MSPQLLSARDRDPQPWRNGGGLTREVVSYPPGSSLEDFDWRLSLAEVEKPGPFSLFPGVDRFLTVLRGKLELRFQSGTFAALSSQDRDVLAFSGDDPVVGGPVDGSVSDLNLMVKRSRFRGKLEYIGCGTHDLRHNKAETTFIFALNDMRAALNGKDFTLYQSDVLMISCDEYHRNIVLDRPSISVSIKSM